MSSIVVTTTDAMPAGDRPVGVFDSGVGGLSVWREIVRALPTESTWYLADQAHVPYGPRDERELRRFCEAIGRFLIDGGCKAVVVACNTASAAALRHLRDSFPHVPILGMEPAVKPAALVTTSGVVGIMATPATFAGRLFRATAGRHAAHVTLVNQVCDGLAESVERGDVDGPAAEALLRRFIGPMLDAGADVIVLACTHYPFAMDAIRRIAGPGVTVIDPAPAVARHLGDVLAAGGLQRPAGDPPQHRFFTTGRAGDLAGAIDRWCGRRAAVDTLGWLGGRLVVSGEADAGAPPPRSA
jgi:glutamate racemase